MVTAALGPNGYLVQNLWSCAGEMALWVKWKLVCKHENLNPDSHIKK